MTNMTVTQAGPLTARVINQEQPNVVSSRIDFNKDINRYWRLVAGVGLRVPSYDASLRFAPSDLDTAATPANFIAARFSGTQWFPTSKGVVTDSSIQIVQDSSFGDFIVGEPRPSSLLAVSVNAGWNLLSLPAIVPDNRFTVIFPAGTTSRAFSYAGSYLQNDTLSSGAGYWIRFGGARSIEVAGLPVVSQTVRVVSGWNLIGSVSDTVLTSSIVSEPPSIITGRFFLYNGAYQTTDSLVPWHGYWVRTRQPGSLIISRNSFIASGVGLINIVPDDDIPPQPPMENHPETRIIARYGLEQNYPNPFNPTTAIRYQLSTNSKVTLRVYDLLGQVVETLKDDVEDEGYRQATWNASAFGSGVYFYRLDATSTSDPTHTVNSVKKMVFLK
jgi:hypothetical protein